MMLMGNIIMIIKRNAIDIVNANNTVCIHSNSYIHDNSFRIDRSHANYFN